MTSYLSAQGELRNSPEGAPRCRTVVASMTHETESKSSFGAGGADPTRRPPRNTQDDDAKRSQAPYRPTWRRIGSFLSVAIAVAALLLLNNNLSLWHPGREAFAQWLEHAAELGTNWLDANVTDIIGNPALVYMVFDMEGMSGEIRLRRLVDGYFRDPSLPSDFLWRRLVDENAKVRPPTRAELDGAMEYQRWILYGLAPHLVRLTDAERSDMFSADKYVWGKRTHQLFALILYRKHGGESEVVNRLIDHLCEGIAFEADWDVRVTDLYLQRVAFLLAAGRADLVKRRWVERMLARQEADGGWKASWHGWGPGLFAFNLSDRWPTAHATVQGMWTVYMLKYRYPEWAGQH